MQFVLPTTLTLATNGGTQSPWFMAGPLVIMMAIFYFMMIRPQQRKERERRTMLDAIKTGDRVIFGGGILGLVSNVKENVLVVKVADNTRLEVLKAGVTRVLQKDEELGKEG